MEQALSRFEALKLCLTRAGTQEQMAHDLGTTQPTVSRWLASSKQLPVEHVLIAERIYGVSRHDLRPDIYPRETMVDRLERDRIAGIDLRASSRFDRRLLGERFLQQEQDAA